MERELLRVVRAVDVARAEPLAHLDQQREARVVRDLVRKPAPRARDPVLLEEDVREVLVPHRAADLQGGREHERRLEGGARGRDDLLVEVGQRHDEPHVVLRDERGERGDVPGVAHGRHERAMVGVVEGRCKRVEVGCDGRRTGTRRTRSRCRRAVPRT